MVEDLPSRIEIDAPPPSGRGAGPDDAGQPPGQEPRYEEAENLDPDPSRIHPLVGPDGVQS